MTLPYMNYPTNMNDVPLQNDPVMLRDHPYAQ